MRLHPRTSSVVVLSIAIGLAAFPAGAATPVTAAAEPASTQSIPSHEVYRIAAGDVVSIVVWGHEQFSQDCQVNGAGTISYPLLGDIQASGLTCLELQARLEEGLTSYLKRPHVMVKVAQYGAAGTSVFVLGEVRAPGVYPVSSNMGLVQAVAAAGGATKLANDEITIVKARTGEICTVGLEEALAGASSTANAKVQPGDVIVVNRKADSDRQRRYAILGEVPKPGMYDIPVDREVSVLDAMENAGILNSGSDGSAESPVAATNGPGYAADLEHALLTRGHVVVPLNLASLLQGDTSQNLLLQEGDVLTVPRRSLIAVYALGEVRTPGKQTLSLNSTLMNLLNAAGGVTSAAHLREASVLRIIDAQPTSIHVDLDALLRHADPEQNVLLQEGDVLFVPSKGERRNDIIRLLPIIPYLLN